MNREPNNDVGTYDHDTTTGRPTQRTRALRHETHPKGGDATYYIDKLDPEHCCGASYGDWGYHGCNNKGRHDYRGFKFCKLHHPPTRFEKKQAREAQYRKEQRAKDRRYQYDRALKNWEQEAIQALRTIATAELNDPAGYAQMILDERPVRSEGD